MLYKYSITLRAYNIRAIGEKSLIEMETESDRLAMLGLNGIESGSILSIVKAAADVTRAIAGAALGGMNVIGR